MGFRRIPVAMTIAGSDSGGGAGIQADLKTFAAMGVHGTSAITSITAQNTMEVRAIHDVPPDVVRSQIEAVADDLGVDAAKTGMLSNKSIIEAVAETVDRYGFPLVVDPVMVAKSGARLLREDAVEAMKRLMVPRATVITPNAPEAEVLAGIKIRGLEDQREAARIIVEELGAQAAVVKGGHLGGDASIDILYYKGEYYELKMPRVKKNTTHGTGCSFSAAIAAGLAKGRSVEEAVRVAKEFITMAIDYGLEIGGGVGPVNPTSWIEVPAERWRVITELEEAFRILKSSEELAVKLVPEVQMNIAMALPPHYARSALDVAAFPGRIGVSNGRLVAKAKPEFGASRHMARLVLTAMRYSREARAAINVRFDEALVEAAESMGYLVAGFSRDEEPAEVRRVEGATLPWALEKAVRELGRVPDVLYDRGGLGKEPMIRIIAETATRAAEKALKMAEKAGL